jgi:hypothetical protein
MGKKAPKRTRGRPRTGSAMTAAERMRRLRKRRKAAGLKAVTAWVPKDRAALPAYSSHRLLEARSLAMHALVARKIERDPTLLAIARRNIDRWSARSQDGPPVWLTQWRELLEQPWQHVAALITEPSERGARMRQSSPFAGVLTNQERWNIHETFRARASDSRRRIHRQ